MSPKTHGKTAIIGLGYVGLPLALEMVKAGMDVIGFDTVAEKVGHLKEGRSYVDDIPDEAVKTAVQSKRFEATTDFSRLAECSDISICVPTPLRPSRDPDTTCIESAMDEVVKHIAPGTLVTLESTTYPGTTRDLVAHRLEALGKVPGRDVFVAFSPERVDPGNAKFGIRNTPKVVGGLTPECQRRAVALYSKIADQVVPVGTPEEAEMVKLLENTFRAVNIALINEFAMLSDRMGIDIWNVIRAAATKPFGYMPFYPGPGIGGHCIPLDPVYLGWKAKSFGFYSRFIETATDINANMPRVVTQKLFKTANSNGLLLKGAKIVVGGLSYKPGIRDPRESPAVEVIQLLCHELMAEVAFVDPIVDTSYDLHLPEGVKGMSLDAAVAWKPDVFVLVTPHAGVEWTKIASASKIVFDTRAAMSKPEKLSGPTQAWIRL